VPTAGARDRNPARHRAVRWLLRRIPSSSAKTDRTAAAAATRRVDTREPCPLAPSPLSPPYFAVPSQAPARSQRRSSPKRRWRLPWPAARSDAVLTRARRGKRRSRRFGDCGRILPTRQSRVNLTRSSLAANQEPASAGPRRRQQRKENRGEQAGLQPRLRGRQRIVQAIQPEFDPKKSQQIPLCQATGAKVALATEIIPLLSTGKRRPLGGVRADVSLANIYYS
jgi:hypothetical protein